MKVKAGDMVMTHKGAAKVMKVTARSGYFMSSVLIEVRGERVWLFDGNAEALEPSPELTAIEAMKVAGRLGV